jgi:hypothetical protein
MSPRALAGILAYLTIVIIGMIILIIEWIRRRKSGVK